MGDCCWFFPLLREVFLRVIRSRRFSPLLKNQHFQIRAQLARTLFASVLIQMKSSMKIAILIVRAKPITTAVKTKPRKLGFFKLLYQFWNHWWSLQSDWLSEVWFIHESHYFPNGVIHVLNCIISVLNRTIFALYRIISVSNTKWDAKALLFRLSTNQLLIQ